MTHPKPKLPTWRLDDQPLKLADFPVGVPLYCTDEALSLKPERWRLVGYRNYSHNTPEWFILVPGCEFATTYQVVGQHGYYFYQRVSQERTR